MQKCECECEYEVVVEQERRSCKLVDWVRLVCVCVWQLGCVEDYYIIIVQLAVKRAQALHGADSRSSEKLGCD